jgi:predicted N-acyltransferase
VNQPAAPVGSPLFAVEVRSALADLDAAAWDALMGTRGFFASTGWLRHAEGTAVECPAYLVATTNKGRYLAGLPAYPLDSRSPYVFCRADFVLAQWWPGAGDWLADLMPSLACGGRNPGHTRVGRAPGLDPLLARDATRALVAAAERHARERGLRSVSFMYVDEDDAVLREVLRGAGYAELPAETAYVLTVPGGQFDDYLAGLGYKFRKAVRRDERALAAAGVTYRVEPATEGLLDRMAAMEAALYARYGTPGDERSLRAVLASVVRVPGARVMMAYRGGRPAGFALTIAWGGELYARQVGFDYTVKGTAPVYFGLAYYAPVRLAQAEGIARICCGVGSGYEKLSRGAGPVRQFTCIRAFDPATQDRLAALAASGAEHGHVELA